MTTPGKSKLHAQSKLHTKVEADRRVAHSRGDGGAPHPPLQGEGRTAQPSGVGSAREDFGARPCPA
jgi:hypothetical protein